MIRTRIAPSPTGDPHIGTAYIGLVNYAFARKHGGQFILRIDDTDQARYKTSSADAIVEAMSWLGLIHNQGPFRQSDRLGDYQKALDFLVGAGHAYPCFCTKERLEALRLDQVSRKVTPGYDRHCRNLSKDVAQDLIANGNKHVIRLAMPLDGETIFTDILRGDIRIKNAGLQDQILLKEDGFPTYHLATCVDDASMGITHIIRAEEWLSSTPIQKVLFEYLGHQTPALCHMPLIRNNDVNKTKISKRKNPTSILYYREMGYHPAAMINFLGLLGGCGPKKDGNSVEVFTLDELIQDFDLRKIRLGGPVFDQKKLKFLNATHQRTMGDADYQNALMRHLGDSDKLARIGKIVKSRTESLADFFKMADFFFTNTEMSPATIVEHLKGRYTADTIKVVLARVVETLELMNDAWVADRITHWLATVAPVDVAQKDIMMMLRLALCGKPATPPLAESMEIMGRTKCLGRLGEVIRQ